MVSVFVKGIQDDNPSWYNASLLSGPQHFYELIKHLCYNERSLDGCESADEIIKICYFNAYLR
jgi:hypothetical protein